MIDGVEILNSYRSIVASTWTWNPLNTVFLFLSLIIGVFSFIRFVICYKNFTERTLGGVIIAFSIFFICICSVANFHQSKTIYEVTIEDDVTFSQFNEFIEKYDIIKQEGKIYHIVEKDDR